MAGKSEDQSDLLGETRLSDTDNQQKRLTDVGWLAGILEGEGCFSLQRKINGTKLSLTPLVQITNTNLLIIDKAQRIVKDLGLACQVYVQKQRAARICYRVVVLGMKRVKRFLDVIDPFIECRREQLECLKAYVNLRLSKAPKAPLERDELELLNKLHVLNRPYLFPETARLPLPTVEMIQSVLRGDTQATQVAVAV